MILGIQKLHELVKEINLVENLCDRELNNPEGAGFDLRLGKIHKISGQGFMGLTERSTPEAELVAQFDENKKSSVVIKPGECFLATIVEKVNLPTNLTSLMTLRSTFYRSGIMMQGGNIAPGYKGELSFLLFNAGPCQFEVEMGSRIVHIVFGEVLGEGNQYRGQWQGGRVSSDNKKEVQV